jgi:hypothetical protein
MARYTDLLAKTLDPSCICVGGNATKLMIQVRDMQTKAK